ncbi:MAG: heme-binding domain-containing protein [Chitinophagales bacterium]
MKKKIGIAVIIILLIIQFFRIDKTNPSSDVASDIFSNHVASEEIRTIVKNACYDCHSNETVYPWYSNIAPVSWWMKRHIDNGREKLNFSLWGEASVEDQAHMIYESVEMLEKNWMPILSYKLTHSEGRLSEEERNMVIDWLESL